MSDPILFADHFEPDDMVKLLSTSARVVVGQLNSDGKPDYFWVDAEGHSRGWSRKQIGEAVGDLDGTEEQLNKDLAACDELTLSIEGFWLPTAHGIQTFQLADSQKSFRMGFHYPPIKSRPQPGLPSRYERWKWSLRHAVGIEVVETPHMVVTAQAISAAFRQSMNPKHSTMQRYLRPHIVPFSPNPHVDNLCRIKGIGIGPVLAEKLIDRFGTVYDVITARKTDLSKEIGVARTEKLLWGLGRHE